MSQSTLNYAAPTATPIRFGPIALASGFLALTSLLISSLTFVDSRLDLSLMLQITPLFQLLSLLNSVAALAATILFQTIHPSPPPKTRARFRRCLAAAITLVVIHFFALALCFPFPDGDRWIQPIPAAPETALAVAASLSVLIQLYLLIHAAFFFLNLANRLNRGPFGTFVACAFMPSTIFLILLFLNEFNLSLRVSNFWIFFQVVTPFHYFLLFLLWLTLALFAAIFAFKPSANSPPSSD